MTTEQHIEFCAEQAAICHDATCDTARGAAERLGAQQGEVDWQQTPFVVRGLSCEPLLEDLRIEQQLQAGLIHWVIVGGESGPGARPMHPAWAQRLREQSKSTGVAYLFKQWGEWTPENTDAKNKIRLTVLGRNGSDLANAEDGYEVWMSKVGKKSARDLLDGVEWKQFPERTA